MSAGKQKDYVNNTMEPLGLGDVFFSGANRGGEKVQGAKLPMRVVIDRGCRLLGAVPQRISLHFR